MKYLSLWEFSRKQDYIFKSNKLIEAVGASLIIKKLTEDFSEYELEEENFIIKKGGKALYAFNSLEEAKGFNEKFSFNLAKEYPGLEVFMVINKFDEEVDDARSVIEDTYELLEKKKRERRNSSYQVAFGIERNCRSTGLPASTASKENGERSFYSKESQKKIDFARNNQNSYFDYLVPEGYELERDMEKFIKDDKKNYISIVHIDGNSMGKKFKTLKDKVQPKKDESNLEFNKRYIKTLKNFSEEVNNAYEEAFKYTLNVIKNNKEKLKEVTNMEDGYFPVRPLIFAGDDITYITNGYIGIESAKVFIERLSKKNLKIEGIDLGILNACAGVSIIKKSYPFIKGYDLAEDLCKNAKKVLVEKEDKNLTVIDFHIAQGEINGDINYIREKDYSVDNRIGILTMRPLIVNNDKEWRTYENFIKTFENITNAIKDKNIGRNKIKALRTELKKGETATEHFVKFYSIDTKRYLPPIHGISDYCFNNQEDGRCMYLDAIEVIDLFIKLEQ